MDAATLLALALACAPQVHPETVRAVVAVESSGNPWAIGVVGGRLERQPSHRTQAIATARSLQAAGWNFNVSLGQINARNFERLGLSIESAFEPCTNLAALQRVLVECFRASTRQVHLPAAVQLGLRRALSCYYSGNFQTGFHHGYVQRVIAAVRIARVTTPTKETS